MSTPNPIEAGEGKSCGGRSCRGGKAVMLGLMLLTIGGIAGGVAACGCHHAKQCAPPPAAAAPVSSPAAAATPAAPGK